MTKAFFLLLWSATSLRADSIQEIRYLSQADKTKQPAMFFAPKSKSPVPLLVLLH